MDNIEKLLKDASSEISLATDLLALDRIRVNYLGKKGQLTELLKGLAKVSPEERPKIGQVINNAKEKLLELFSERGKALQLLALEAGLAKEAIDITLPGRGHGFGSLHPVTKARYEMEDFFCKMGFSVVEGPEIETDYYNFVALNFPENHPARKAHDTFYFQDGTLLRTHTSPVQIRAMQKMHPPIRIITPGRVFRCDSDATHSPMFNQMEVLMIGEDVTFANLKWLLNKLLENFFNEKVQLRFRPSYFPFTEPSAEVDIEWKLDGGVRWLEVGGCGMVHPNVLKNCNIDANKYSGFAFGFGIDRFAMLKYGINSIKLFFENDVQFLEQF